MDFELHFQEKPGCSSWLIYLLTGKRALFVQCNSSWNDEETVTSWQISTKIYSIALVRDSGLHTTHLNQSNDLSQLKFLAESQQLIYFRKNSCTLRWWPKPRWWRIGALCEDQLFPSRRICNTSSRAIVPSLFRIGWFSYKPFSMIIYCVVFSSVQF